MNETELERELRAGLSRAVEDAPMVPRLADDVVRRGRRVRRRRVAGTGAALAAVAAAGVLVVAPLRSTTPDAVPAAAPTGPPAVPLWVSHGDGTLYDRLEGTTMRSRSIGTASVVAAVPAGVLLSSNGSDSFAVPALQILGPDDERPRTVVPDLADDAVAVAGDGTRAVVVAGTTAQRVLREVALPSGRQLRAVPVAPPLAGPDEPIRPVAYAGDVVLLAVGEGATARTAVWEPGGDAVIGRLSEVMEPVGGTSRDGTGLAAVRTSDRRCDVRILELRNGDRGWDLCREGFAGFSPGGELILTTDPADAGPGGGDGVVVRDSRSGDEVFRHVTDEPVRAYGWESDVSVLLSTTTAAGRTVVVRCVVASGDCRPVFGMAGEERVPRPVPAYR